MSYTIEFAPSAARRLNRLPAGVRSRINAAIDALANTPRPTGAKKLAGADDCYRIREGDYRIVYLVREQAALLLVVAVGHRRDVYHNLTLLLKQARRK